MHTTLLTEKVVVKEVEVEMEVVVIQYSKNLPSLDPSIAGDLCSFREGSSSTEASSLKDNWSIAMALFLLPVHAVGALAAVET